MNLDILRLKSLVCDLFIPVYMRETGHEVTHYIHINNIPWALSNENLLTMGITIWPARAKSMAIALGDRGCPQEIADRALQYIEQMTPQVEQMRLPRDQ